MEHKNLFLRPYFVIFKNINFRGLVISDHRPLQWLESFKDTNGRIGRWPVQLANMRDKIIYKPGKVHQNADCVSRIQMTCIIPNKDSEWSIITAQTEDFLWKDTNDYLNNVSLSQQNKDNHPDWVKNIQLYNNTNGILTRDFWPTSQTRRNSVFNWFWSISNMDIE